VAATALGNVGERKIKDEEIKEEYAEFYNN
jgi:hypothetical protein